MVADVASWIAGLMRENYDAVGFIPEPTVERQYVANKRHVLQHDEVGRRTGYLLHSTPVYGHALSVAQHCIEYDRRQHGYGEAALLELIERANAIGASCITARVAIDLDALGFWLAQGFEVRDIVLGGSKRDRQIARIWLPLSLPLLTPNLMEEVRIEEPAPLQAMTTRGCAATDSRAYVLKRQGERSRTELNTPAPRTRSTNHR